METVNGVRSSTRDEYQKQMAALKREGESLRASANRWNFAVKATSAVASIALAPLTLLTGCEGQTAPSQPPIVPPVHNEDPDSEVTLQQNNPTTEGTQNGNNQEQEIVPNPNGGFAIKNLKMTTDYRHPNDTDPGGNVGPISVGTVQSGIYAVGYTNKDWKVRNFVDTGNGVDYKDIKPENLRPEDRDSAAFGTYISTTIVDENNAPIEVVNMKPEIPANVTEKSIAIINASPDTVLYPGNYIIFPLIFVKGSKINEESGQNVAQYLTTTSPFVDSNGNNIHDELEMFYQTGLSIAFKRSAANQQLRIYTYADQDPLTGELGGTGRVLDPRVTTAAHFSWSIDKNGIPKMMWGNRYPNEITPLMFNTYPLIGLDQTPENKKAFLVATTGNSLPEQLDSEFGYSIEEKPENEIPADGKLYYNSDRNVVSPDNANGYKIIGRSQAGLIYASKPEASRILSGVVHNQILVKFPEEGVGVPQEILENGAQLNIRYTAVEEPISENTSSLKSDPSKAF